MLTLTLGGMLQGMLATVFVVLCLLLCLIIVIQKPRGGGLSGAFGGAGGGAQMFGGKSGDILTWITVGFFVAFLVIGMGLVVVTRNEARASSEGQPPAETLEDPAGGLPDLGDLPFVPVEEKPEKKGEEASGSDALPPSEPAAEKAVSPAPAPEPPKP